MKCSFTSRGQTIDVIQQALCIRRMRSKLVLTSATIAGTLLLVTVLKQSSPSSATGISIQLSSRGDPTAIIDDTITLAHDTPSSLSNAPYHLVEERNPKSTSPSRVVVDGSNIGYDSPVRQKKNKQRLRSRSRLLPGNEWGDKLDELGQMDSEQAQLLAAVLFVLLILWLLCCCCGCSLWDLLLLYCCCQICNIEGNELAERFTDLGGF